MKETQVPKADRELILTAAEQGEKAMTTNKRYHMGVDVRGALMRWRAKEWRGVCKRDNGTPMTPQEAKQAFLDELAQGHEIIPYGRCDNWDWKQGCQGHDCSAPPENSCS